MDRMALELANRLVGNGPSAAGFEWALGGGRIGFTDARAIATGAPGAAARLNGNLLPPWECVSVKAGDELAIEPPASGRFAYLAISGGLQVPLVLDSRSTYLPGRFGGHEGRRLRAGDRLPLGGREALPHHASLAEAHRPDYARAIRLVDGPQHDLFGDEAWELLLSGRYTVSAASDRMGYRLEGAALTHCGPASLPSEPACPGAIQIPDGGAPIVLMPDGPTVGGYPKLAVVITADLGVMAQLTPGTRPRFERVTLDQAVAALRGQRRVCSLLPSYRHHGP
jgi:antagonist of KipI